MTIHWEWKSFRQLTAIQLYKILQHREQIFAVEQNEAYLDADSQDVTALHLLGKDEADQLVGYARVFWPTSDEPFIKFGRVSIAHAHRGQGNARLLIQQILKKIEQSEYACSPIQISAQEYLRDFYRKFGFECVGNIYYTGKIPHIKMQRSPIHLFPEKKPPHMLTYEPAAIPDIDVLDVFSIHGLRSRI